MEYEVKDSGTWKKEVTVTVPEQEVEERRAEILREMNETLSVPGFRPGHTPFEVLEMRYEKDITDQLKRKVITDAVAEAIEKSELKPVSVPDVDPEEVEIAKGRPVKFSFSVEVRPEFELPDYSKIKVERKPVEVKDEDVDEALESLRARFAEFRSSEGSAGPGDAIVCDYTISVDGEVKVDQKEDLLALPTEDDDIKTLVGCNFPVPKEALEDAKAGDEKEFEFTVPDDFEDEELRGKKAVFKVKVMEIRKRRLPDLDDAFAKRLGTDDLETLRTHLRRRIAQERENAAAAELRESITEQLIELTDFELPKDLLESHSKYIEARSILQLARLGMTQDQLQEQRENLAKTSAENAEKELRKTFIFSAIAEAENIEVEEEEVEERINDFARYWNTTPVEARSRLRENGGLSSIYEDILEEKVLDFLADKLAPANAPERPSPQAGEGEKDEEEKDEKAEAESDSGGKKESSKDEAEETSGETA